MTCQVPQKDKRAQLLSLICIVAAVALYYTSSLVSAFIIVYQITALVLMIFGVEILLKYVMSNYEYEATENDLRIYKMTGRKTQCVCSLAYSESLSAVLTAREYEQSKASYPATKLAVNHCKNIFPREYAVYLFNFNGKPSLLKFEPDAAFVSYVNDRIRQSLQTEEEDHD